MTQEMLPLDSSVTLTIADIDEWLKLARDGGLTSAWCPSAEMRDALAAILGKEFRHRAYPKSEMVSILAQARLALGEPAADQYRRPR